MKPGTIILVRHQGFLPAQIRLHMRVWARIIGARPSPWNHAETVVTYNGILMSMGARRGGAEMTPLAEYLNEHPDHMLLEPIVDLTDREMRALEIYAKEVCITNKRPYQNAMFLAWIAKIKSWGLFNWGDKTDNQVYCYELAHLCAQLTGRAPAADGLVSVYDLLDLKDYKHKKVMK